MAIHSSQERYSPGKVSWFTWKRFFIALTLIIILAGGATVFFAKDHKQEFALGGLSAIAKVSKFLPLEADTKKELAAVNQLAEALLKKDGIQRTYLVLLQNNYELRPGGGFLGQYAIVKVKDGQVLSTFVEDANLLDQRITVKITPPYPLTRKLQLKRWKMRDSNFSPDFPTNAAKAEYFYRLAGGGQKFDGVIAINANVFDHALVITGPITPPGYSTTFTSDGGALKLEEVVEKAYLGDDVAAELKQNRKAIMKVLATEMVKRLATVENIPKMIEFAHRELGEKNVMLSFKDTALQDIVAGVKWDGTVNTDWNNDYLMLVDANLGALKSDYFVSRSVDYTVDFTGEKPIATLTHTYKHRATYGDWRTSDYHSYLRAYVPKGAKLLERQLVSYPLTDEAFNKTFFGVFVDAVMNHETPGMIKYELPDTIKEEGYQLLLQKQSGVGTTPVTITIKRKDGSVVSQSVDLKKDLVLSFQEVEEKK
ncbi:MAG: DUF4012 domain-containing protein [Candidatus Moraniibacteriota bacterium]|nr:MAG: DUF4012 domain-containing protein [Candidatus Moranbacteria bacterium]